MPGNGDHGFAHTKLDETPTVLVVNMFQAIKGVESIFEERNTAIKSSYNQYFFAVKIFKMKLSRVVEYQIRRN